MHYNPQTARSALLTAATLLTGLIQPAMGQQTLDPATTTKTAESTDTSATKTVPDAEAAKAKSSAEQGWISLLPKKGLEGWEISDFGSEAKVTREGDNILIAAGDPLNGITSKKKDFPKDNFEIRVQAKRTEGNDFLCGLTFPVGDEFCSLIAGGWGGGLVGLSSLNGMDASENSTTTYHEFENDRWYEFKLRVDPEYVRAWIDDKEFFRTEREYHQFSTRIEVFASQPLGYCTFQSTVAIRKFEYRTVGEKNEGAGKKEAAEKKSGAAKTPEVPTPAAEDKQTSSDNPGTSKQSGLQ